MKVLRLKSCHQIGILKKKKKETFGYIAKIGCREEGMEMKSYEVITLVKVTKMGSLDLDCSGYE